MQLDALKRCANAAPVVFDALADAMEPQRRMSVSEWAEQNRVVSAESGSRYPGPWRNDRAPHLVEIMDSLGPDDPAEDIPFVKSAQVGGSEVGVNFFGYVADQDPGPMLIVLPSHDEANKYSRIKMQPAIDESPVLRRKVLELKDRSERGSTAAFKKFRGGFCQVTFAGSSKGLQSVSIRYTLGDEVSEWPAEAGERGDPVTQVKKRTEIFERDRKRLWVSTPAILGTCRITQMYEGDDGRGALDRHRRRGWAAGGVRRRRPRPLAQSTGARPGAGLSHLEGLQPDDVLGCHRRGMVRRQRQLGEDAGVHAAGAGGGLGRQGRCA
mgnify:CR=1 FL=1